jgi:hypothetical protein
LYKSSIEILEIELLYEELNSRILNSFIFANVRSLIISGLVEKLEENVFDGLKLNFLKFSLENLKDFFHKASFSSTWRAYLENYETDFLMVIFDYPNRYGSFNNEYSYSDEDFCLFRNFPNEKQRVFYNIISNKMPECSCTQRYLLRNNFIIQDKIWSKRMNFSFLDPEFAYIYDYHFPLELNETHEYCMSNMYNTTPLVKCDFEKMKSICTLNNVSYSKFHAPITDTGVYFLIMWLQYILLVICQPILCGLSILTNTLTIVVIRNKRKKKNFKDQMYKLVTLNAMFNITFCLIMIIKLGNECVFYYWSIFCSSIYQSEFMQYFKFIVVEFLGNTLRSCGSLSYLAFSLSRFILISEELKKKKFLQRFSKIKIKAFLIGFTLFSTLISGYKLFQFKINELSMPFLSFPFEINDNKHCKITKSAYCRLFNVFKSIDVAFNDVIFLLLSLFLDIFLFKTFKKEMEGKRKMLNSTKNSGDDLDKKQDDVIKMVITNGLVYFLAHMPVFLTSILLISFSNNMFKFCSYKFSCDIINEIAKFHCLISMFLQFFIFLRYNSVFKNSFKDIKDYYLKKN